MSIKSSHFIEEMTYRKIANGYSRDVMGILRRHALLASAVDEYVAAETALNESALQDYCAAQARLRRADTVLENKLDNWRSYVS